MLVWGTSMAVTSLWYVLTPVSFLDPDWLRTFSPFIQLGVLLLSILPSARWYGSILGLLLSFGEDWQSRLEDKVADVGTDIDILIPGLDVDGDDALKSCVRAIQRHATPGARRSDSKCLPWSSFKKFLDHITCT